MQVEGEMVCCIDIDTTFQSGYKTRSDASAPMSNEQIADVALSLEYVKQYGTSHTELNHKQVYLLEQCIVWQRLSIHIIDFLFTRYKSVNKCTFMFICDYMSTLIQQNSQYLITYTMQVPAINYSPKANQVSGLSNYQSWAS